MIIISAISLAEMLYSLFPTCSSHYTCILQHHFSQVSDEMGDEMSNEILIKLLVCKI